MQTGHFTGSAKLCWTLYFSEIWCYWLSTSGWAMELHVKVCADSQSAPKNPVHNPKQTEWEQHRCTQTQKAHRKLPKNLKRDWSLPVRTYTATLRPTTGLATRPQPLYLAQSHSYASRQTGKAANTEKGIGKPVGAAGVTVGKSVQNDFFASHLFWYVLKNLYCKIATVTNIQPHVIPSGIRSFHLGGNVYKKCNYLNRENRKNKYPYSKKMVNASINPRKKVVLDLLNSDHPSSLT